MSSLLVHVACDREDGVGERARVHGVVLRRTLGVATVDGWGTVRVLTMGLMSSTPLMLRLRLHAVGVHLRRSDSELTDELLLQVIVPGHHHLGHLAEGRQGAGTHEEVVGQIDLGLGATLVDHKGVVVASSVQIGETELENDDAGVGGKPLNGCLELLLPTELGIEADLGKTD